MREIKIDTKIELKEYLKLAFILTYRRKIIRILFILGFILLVWGVLSLSNLWYYFGILTYIQLVIAIFILGYLPFFFYWNAKKFYSSNERLKEKIAYTFTDSHIIIQGESFHSELTWEKTHKIVELRNWWLIFQNRNSANAIPKRCFSNESLVKFKELIQRQNSVTKHFL